MGLCGGMAFVGRDCFEAGAPQLRGTDSSAIPAAVAQHILGRLVESFDGPGTVGRWLSATSELDHGTVLRGDGLFADTVRACPEITAEIDAGRLCPIGVVLTESFAPWAVFDNHVELVWGYERDGNVLTLHTYDCNAEGSDQVVIQLDVSTTKPAKPITTNGTSGPTPGHVRGFFRVPYGHADPSPLYVDDAIVQLVAAPPAQMALGATADVAIAATNTGSTTWTPGAGYRLGSQAPQDNTAWGLGRVELSVASVDPQQNAWFSFRASAPGSAGRYGFAWRMVHEAVRWFGTTTPALQVAVGGTDGVCAALHDQHVAAGKELQEVQAELAAIDWSDPVIARHEAAALSARARALQAHIADIERQQVANRCAPV
jgi:hypothetical protein